MADILADKDRERKGSALHYASRQAIASRPVVKRGNAAPLPRHRASRLRDSRPRPIADRSHLPRPWLVVFGFAAYRRQKHTSIASARSKHLIGFRWRRYVDCGTSHRLRIRMFAAKLEQVGARPLKCVMKDHSGRGASGREQTSCICAHTLVAD